MSVMGIAILVLAIIGIVSLIRAIVLFGERRLFSGGKDYSIPADPRPIPRAGRPLPGYQAAPKPMSAPPRRLDEASRLAVDVDAVRVKVDALAGAGDEGPQALIDDIGRLSKRVDEVAIQTSQRLNEMSAFMRVAIAALKPVCPACDVTVKQGDAIVLCPNCAGVYHDDCWRANEGCATFGCKKARDERGVRFKAGLDAAVRPPADQAPELQRAVYELQAIDDQHQGAIEKLQVQMVRVSELLNQTLEEKADLKAEIARLETENAENIRADGMVAEIAGRITEPDRFATEVETVINAGVIRINSEAGQREFLKAFSKEAEAFQPDLDKLADLCVQDAPIRHLLAEVVKQIGELGAQAGSLALGDPEQTIPVVFTPASSGRKSTARIYDKAIEMATKPREYFEAELERLVSQKLLPILDACYRNEPSFQDEAVVDQIAANFGLEDISPGLREILDPANHELLQVAPGPLDQILKVKARGYRYKPTGKVLRKPLVIVGSG